jgi:hypothetical protein
MTGPLRCSILTVMLASLTGCAPSEPTPATPVAKIGPVTIAAADLLGETQRQTAAQGRNIARLPPGRVYESASQILSELIDEQVVAQRASPESRAAAVRLTDKLIARQSVTDWQRRTSITAYTLAAEAQRTGQLPAPPTDAELHTLYLRDPTRWANPAEADIRIVIVNLPPDERSAQARHRCRANVTAAAETGPWQTLTVRHGQTQPQVEAMAWRTHVGQRSPVFQVGPGYAIIEVTARRPSTAQPFDAVRNRMRDTIHAERDRVFFRQLRQQWRDDAQVEIWLHHDTFGGPTRPPPAWPAVTLFILAGGAAVTWSWRRWKGGWMPGAFATGLVLRLALWIVTPYDWLSHDEEEHLDYIAHVAHHLAMPDHAQGFMFYQPPLYYVAAGLLGRLAGDPFAVRVYQGFALVLAGASLWFALDAMRRLTGPGKADTTTTGLAAVALAVVPSWTFFATRINNDVLAAFFAFAAAWFLIRWWQEGRQKDWVAGMVVVALGLLTKTTAALLLPVWALAWALRSTTPWRERARLAALGAIVVLALAGWFFGQRFVGERQQQLSGNVAWIPPDSPMWVDRQPATLLTFRPDRLWRQPYVHGAMPGLSRDNFWEYFLRTAWYGEFSFRQVPVGLIRALIIAGLTMTILVVAGFIRAQNDDWRTALPMTAMFLVVLAGHVAYRQLAPLNVSQDFRYSVILLLPAIYCVTQAIPRQRPILTRAANTLIVLWTLLSLLVLGHLLVLPK